MSGTPGNTLEHQTQSSSVPEELAENRQFSALEHREHREHHKNDRGGHVVTMRSPLWGPCRLTPREVEPTDAVAMGYVALAGNPDSLKLAIWKDGQWFDHRAKSFQLPVVQSYYVEKMDGSPIF